MAQERVPRRRRLGRIAAVSAISALVFGPLIPARGLFRAALSANQVPVARAGADRFLGVAPLQLAVISLDGSQSFDPDGDTLSFEWRGPGGSVIGSASIVTASLAAGSYVFALTVNDGRGATASDSVRIEVVLDNVAPAVIPPEDLGVSATEPGGARGADIPSLAAFLAGGDATDALDPTLIRLAPQVAGADVDNDSLFPIGTTSVTFRFRDSSGNTGSGTADLTVVELKPGDLFVGAGIVGDEFGNTYGAVQLVRGGSFSPFCQSPIASSDPGFFNVPQDVIVDSRGRVVFLAPTRPGLTLFRCDGPGATPIKLAVFPTRTAADPGDPVPFAGKLENLSGLHLARTRSIVIDDDVDGGIPKLVTDDLYGLVLATRDADTNLRSGLRTVRYRPRTGEWEDGPEPPQKYAHSASTFMPDAVNHGGATYFVHEEVLRKFTDPLHLDASAHIGEFDFRLVVSMFAGFREADGVITDDDKIANLPTGCVPAPPVRNDMPYKDPGLVPMSRLYGAAFDEDGGLGFVITSDYAFLTPYLTNVSDALLNAQGSDDPRFQQPYLGCVPVPVLDHSSILPFYDPDNSANGATVIATAPGGLVATQAFAGRVVRVVPGTSVETIVSGLVRPTGIASFPAAVPAASGLVIVIRLDSPVNLLLTDSGGRRIGVDPSTGLSVNDFGEKGFDSGSGEPRYYAISGPLAGDYHVSSVGTASGPFAVNVFSMDFSSRAGRRIRATGSASPGETASHDFTLGSGGEISFVPTNRAPVAAAGLDQVLQATSAAGAVVSLSGIASYDPDGDALEFTWAGPFGALAGPTIGPTLPVGLHSITLTVNDGQGGSADDAVSISVLPNTPSPTESPTGTPAPTDPPSPTASPTSTKTLTPSPTSTATVTLTSTPTLEPSTTPSATSTRTPTAPPEPINTLPIISGITGPASPISLGTPGNGLATVSASFSDVDTQDTHSCTFSWDDGPLPTATIGAITEVDGSGTCAGSFSYVSAGVYSVTAVLTDSGSGSTTAVYEFVVIYDPEGGFVTGGGWIMSPAGAYSADPALTGKATFGFVSKYKKGTTIPTGETDFQFHAADFDFHSASYDWLVVAGARAQYKGSGTINGAGEYGFLLTALDGQVSGGGGTDKLRMKIWNKANSNAIVYDNMMGAPDGDQPTTVLGGGSIVVHKK